MTDAKLVKIGIGLAVVVVLLTAIGVADILSDDDTTTPEPSRSTPAEDVAEQGGERAGEPDRRRDRDRAGEPDRRRERNRAGEPDRRRDRNRSPSRDRSTSRERQPTERQERRPTAVITRVIDGDTVELDNGKTVRMIGIDTPEVYGASECGGREASAYMERIATGRRVSVHTDPTQDTYDRYGRLLAYLDAGETDLGKAMLRAGWAQVYVYDQPFERLAAYREAASSAVAANRGLSAGC